MSRKHSELEREFLDELALRTGRSLAAWMSAIDAAGIGDRNAIIDWLRPQGLTFAHASWLERIHHNGGRPIYIGVPGGGVLPTPVKPQPQSAAGMPAAQHIVEQKAVVAPRALVPSTPPASPAVQPLPVRAVPSPRMPATNAGPQQALSVADLVLRGKGLRPLAEHVLREIQRALPSSTASAAGDLISLCNPGGNPVEIAVLAVSPRDLRLGLALGPVTGPVTGLVTSTGALVPTLAPARIPGAGPAITHMAILNDARQVDQALIGLVVLAGSAADTI